MVYVDQIALEKLSMIVSTLRAFINRVQLEPGKAGHQGKSSIDVSRMQGAPEFRMQSEVADNMNVDGSTSRS
jgi:hypothetical protein